MRNKLGFFLLLAVISSLPGCGFYWNLFGPELHLYDGPKREAHDMATIVQGAGCYTCVESISRQDEKIPIYAANAAQWEPVGSGLNHPKKIVVPPGRYRVTLSTDDAARSSGYVDLLPGHSYRVQNDILSDFHKAFVWMEDEGTGEVVLGEKK